MNAELLKMARMSRKMTLISAEVTHNERVNACEIKTVVMRFERGKRVYQSSDKFVHVGHTIYNGIGWVEDVGARRGHTRCYRFVERQM